METLLKRVKKTTLNRTMQIILPELLRGKLLRAMILESTPLLQRAWSFNSSPLSSWCGHICCQRNCAEIPYGSTLTAAQATELLKSDLKGPVVKCLIEALPDTVWLTTNQYATLASWAMSIGCDHLKASPLVSRSNAGLAVDAITAEELPIWNNVGGKMLLGIRRRRMAELKFLSCDSSSSLSACAFESTPALQK